MTEDKKNAARVFHREERSRLDMVYNIRYPSIRTTMINDSIEDRQKAIALLHNARLRLVEEIAKIDKQMDKIKSIR